jgi:hypothetical protein
MAFQLLESNPSVAKVTFCPINNSNSTKRWAPTHPAPWYAVIILSGSRAFAKVENEATNVTTTAVVSFSRIGFPIEVTDVTRSTKTILVQPFSTTSGHLLCASGGGNRDNLVALQSRIAPTSPGLLPLSAVGGTCGEHQQIKTRASLGMTAAQFAFSNDMNCRQFPISSWTNRGLHRRRRTAGNHRYSGQ